MDNSLQQILARWHARAPGYSEPWALVVSQSSVLLVDQAQHIIVNMLGSDLSHEDDFAYARRIQLATKVTRSLTDQNLLDLTDQGGAFLPSSLLRLMHSALADLGGLLTVSDTDTYTCLHCNEAAVQPAAILHNVDCPVAHLYSVLLFIQSHLNLDNAPRLVAGKDASTNADLADASDDREVR